MPSFQLKILKQRLIPAVSAVFFTLIVVLGSVHGRELSDDLFDVSFSGEKDGWACGRMGSVLHTSNGGKTWVAQKSGTDFTLSSICFVDPKTGWAVGDGGTIIHTRDGGVTWEKQKSPVSYFLMGAYFANKRKGWIVTERTHILYTKDGGHTWQIQFSDEDFILKRVSFCDELNGWAVGEFGYTYHTNDGGVTWEHQAGEFDLSEETGEIIGGNFLFDVIAVSPSTAWVAGIDGYVARTTDGGMTWRKTTKGVPRTHLFGITTDRKGNVFLGGSATLHFSSDDGKIFQASRAEPAVEYGYIYSIRPRGRAGFVAVGSSGWIYLADRNMKLWQRVLRE